ncbi:MAG: DUF3006 domain-containing protein [Clostridiales bacterium]|nr:DUF3006 domain-containing protein [Clostridiales bacterium]
MKRLTIIKFDMNMAICEDKDKKLFGIYKSELPQEATQGSIIEINNEGNIELIRG